MAVFIAIGRFMSIGARVKKRRNELGMTQVNLSEQLGMAQQSLQKIESGITKNPRNIEKLAKALQCTPEYLRFRVLEIVIMLAQVLLVKSRLPLISWVQAGAWSEIQEVSPLEAEHFMCPVNCSEKSFVLKVQGISMEPKFLDGDLIFVDPEARPEHGSYVVARLDDENQATFKQLIIEGGQKFLKALNPIIG